MSPPGGVASPIQTKHMFRSLIFTCLFAAGPLFLSAQPDTLSQYDIKGSSLFLIEEADLIDAYLPRVADLDRSSREELMEQNVKTYMMPPRRYIRAEDALYYALASCLEFYVNYDQNYKVNLSPDFIRLSADGTDLPSLFETLRESGTISAAIMDFGSQRIPAGVGATKRYRVNRYFSLFQSHDRPRQKMMQIRKALQRGNPVLVMLAVDDSFGELTDQRYYTGGKQHAPQARPFCVVGFDEDINSVEVRGYYGRNWGSNGYLWIDYEDFAEMASAAYVLDMGQTP